MQLKGATRQKPPEVQCGRSLKRFRLKAKVSTGNMEQ